VGARIFTTLFPHVVVVTGGIHFHHFWYGLGMVLVAGLLGIVSTVPSHNRSYAIIFGLGAGLIGDEVGLFLTFGNYYSDLTYFVAVAFFASLAVAILLYKSWGALKADLNGTHPGEALSHWGILIAGLSVLAFSFNNWILGLGFLAVGVAIIIVGRYLHSRRTHPNSKMLGDRTVSK
jgi:hypothetical protein